MTDTIDETTTAPDWKPGDVANNHVLTEDGRWRELSAEPLPVGNWEPFPLSGVEERQRAKRTWLWLAAAAAVVTVLVIVIGVAASGSAGKGGSAVKWGSSSGQGHAMSEAEAKLKVGSVVLDHSDDLVAENEATSAALDVYDVDGAVAHTQESADIAGQIADEIEADEALAASAFGSETIDVYRQCEAAYSSGADAIAVLDTDAIDAASAELNVCSDGISGLTAQVE